MTSLLEVEDLVVRFHTAAGEITAVDGVSFRVEAGQVFALVGESGSGKSTTARTILRLVPATAGVVRLRGEDLSVASGKQLRRLRREIQIVFQDPYASLDPRRTAEEAIAEGLEIHRLVPNRRARRERVVELLEKVGLSASHLPMRPHALSGGQRQRIAIARALAVEPKILILDEPVTALDASVRAQVMNLFADLRDELGLTFLFITHDLALVRHFANEVAVMSEGRIVETGTPTDVLAAPTHDYTKALVDAVPIADPALEAKRRAVRGSRPHDSSLGGSS